MFLSMALVWHYVALRFALNRRARFRSPRGCLLEQAGGPTWPNRGGLLGQVGGCRGPSLTFGWVEKLFTRPRLGGSQVLHSPSGGLKGSSFIPGCEFKSLRSLFGSHRFFTHLGWVTRFILHVERTPLDRVESDMEPSIVISDYGEAKNTADPCSTMRVGLTRPGQW